MTMRREGCLILCYHHIAEPSEDNGIKRFYVMPRNFERQMEYLRKNKFSVLGLDEFVEILRQKQNIPTRSIVLTFDDGYKSFFNFASGVLKSNGFKATVFMPTGKTGGLNDWDKGVRDDAGIMSLDDILLLSKDGFSFHSHSVNHLRLTSLPDKEIADELEKSKSVLESILGQRECFFCYPFSDFDERVKSLVKKIGYLCGCTSLSGVNNIMTDIFLLRRIEITAEDTMLRFIYKIQCNRFIGRSD